MGKWIWRVWENYLESGGVNGDVDELVYLITEGAKILKDGFMFLGGIIVLGVENTVRISEILIELLFFLIKAILYILDKFMMGFLSVWDGEEYKKIQNDKWKR